jgi:hypothetical protein
MESKYSYHNTNVRRPIESPENFSNVNIWETLKRTAYDIHD